MSISGVIFEVVAEAIPNRTTEGIPEAMCGYIADEIPEEVLDGTPGEIHD